MVMIGRVPNQVLVPPAGLKRKELFRGVVTCFGPRDMSEVDSQKVSGPAAKNQSERPKLEFGTIDHKIASPTQGHHPFRLPHGTPAHSWDSFGGLVWMTATDRLGLP